MPTPTAPVFPAPEEVVSQLPVIEGVTPFEDVPVEAPLLDAAFDPIPKVPNTIINGQPLRHRKTKQKYYSVRCI